MQSQTRAFAKVNLHLEVLNRRPDGFHNIFSLMASVTLSDLLKLESIRLPESPGVIGTVSITASGGSFADIITTLPEHDNLIVRAASAYLRETRVSADVAFSIEKNIPSGAGLGGGSSDAAAALRLLNEHFGALDDDRLRRLGATIGADVPFCLTGGYAICEGIGDMIEPLHGRLAGYVLIANDGIHVNTGTAYASLQRTAAYERKPEDLNRTREIIANDVACGSVSRLSGIQKNDFETPVFREHPRVQHIKKLMESQRPELATMTGSGSSIIGLFNDRDRACRAQEILSHEVRHCFITEFL